MPLSDLNREKVRKLRLENPHWTGVEIADELGISQGWAWELLRSMGLQRQRPERPRCLVCGEIRPYANGKYCSRVCFTLARNTELVCRECGEWFTRPNVEVDIQIRQRHTCPNCRAVKAAERDRLNRQYIPPSEWMPIFRRDKKKKRRRKND